MHFFILLIHNKNFARLKIKSNIGQQEVRRRKMKVEEKTKLKKEELISHHSLHSRNKILTKLFKMYSHLIPKMKLKMHIVQQASMS